MKNRTNRKQKSKMTDSSSKVNNYIACKKLNYTN